MHLYLQDGKYHSNPPKCETKLTENTHDIKIGGCAGDYEPDPPKEDWCLVCFSHLKKIVKN